MLDEVPEARIRDVLSQMATDGFLTIAEGRLPIVGFGPRAAETVAPEFHYDIKKIKRADARARRTPDVSTPAASSYVPDDGDEALFQKLRALRLDIARELGKPPYIVFSDKTLRDMVRVKPIADDQFLAVNGVGKASSNSTANGSWPRFGRIPATRLEPAITDTHGTTVGVEPANRE